MSFIDFARANGVDIDISRLYPSENIKRTGTVDKPKSTNGASIGMVSVDGSLIGQERPQ